MIDSRFLALLRPFLAVSALVVGALVVLVTVAVGRCDAFGGRCPATAGVSGDVVVGIAFGAALAIGGPMIAARPDRHRVRLAVLVVAAVVPALAWIVGGAVTSG